MPKITGRPAPRLQNAPNDVTPARSGDIQKPAQAPQNSVASANDQLDAQPSTTSLGTLTPAHDGAVNLTSSAALQGHGLKAPGDDQKVVNKSLARTLRVAFKSCQKHFDYVGDARRPDNAYPKIRAGRREIWDNIDRIDRSHLNRESPELREAIGNLKEFADDWRYSTDEANMPRKWYGTSRQNHDGTWTKKPGLKALLGEVFKAAGMGDVEEKPRPWS